MTRREGSTDAPARRAIVAPVVFTVAVVLLLELMRRLSGLSAATIPRLTDVIADLADLVADGAFWQMVRETMSAWLLSLGLAMLIGIPLGFLMGSNRWAQAAFTVPVEFLRPVPSVALIPLVVVMWGSGLESKLFLATFAAIWPLLYQARYGAASIDPVLRQTAAVYGLSRVGRVRFVIGPSLLPFVATGVRLSASIALILTITAELLVGGGGLGGGIVVAREGADLLMMYALVFVTGVIGYALSAHLAEAEKYLLFWHPTHRAVEA